MKLNFSDDFRGSRFGRSNPSGSVSNETTSASTSEESKEKGTGSDAYVNFDCDFFRYHRSAIFGTVVRVSDWRKTSSIHSKNNIYLKSCPSVLFRRLNTDMMVSATEIIF